MQRKNKKVTIHIEYTDIMIGCGEYYTEVCLLKIVKNNLSLIIVVNITTFGDKKKL